MTIGEIKKQLSDELFGMAPDNTPTNISCITFTKDGTMSPRVTFYTYESLQPKNKGILSVKDFVTLVQNIPSFIIDNLITNIVSVKQTISEADRSIGLLFGISIKNDEKTLTGKELRDIVNALNEDMINAGGTNVAYFYMMTENPMCPKLFINRPDLIENA